MIELSDDQKKIVQEVGLWYAQFNAGIPVPQYITIGGYAGTGKTSLVPEIKKIVEQINGGEFFSAALVAFTGKASSVIRDKFGGNISSADHVGTIHSLIYRPVFEFDDTVKKKVITGWKRNNYISEDIIIIDEASMVSKPVWDDLLSFGIPIVAIGDHGQLPPVSKNKFNLMDKPNLKLTNIHRQALNSPIISLSQQVRRTGIIPHGIHSNTVFKLRWDDPQCQRIWNQINFDTDVIVLCGMNSTRTALNKSIRDSLGYSNPNPYPGERVICLKNNHNSGIMNGQLGSLMWLTHLNREIYKMTVEMDGGEIYSTASHKCCFGEEKYESMWEMYPTPKRIIISLKRGGFKSLDFFDFGYTISVHRSQGSEWDKVVLFEERSNHWDDEFYQRWLYTGVTRAKHKLFIIG